MAKKTLYSHDLRMLVCSNCGAPLEVDVMGGLARCAYCGANHSVTRRDESRDIAAAAQASRFASESERLHHLRLQDGRAREIPADLRRLVIDGKIAPAALEEVRQQWLAVRRNVQQGAGITEQERLFELTVLLERSVGRMHARAVLEDAVELLSDGRHRQILRCKLARNAAREGDVVAAREWLRPCIARSDDLEMDTAYRIAACHVAVAERDLRKVENLLGLRPDEVPIHDDFDAEAALLRAHARELSGDERGARELLVASMQQQPRLIDGLLRAVEEAPPALRPRTFRSAYDQVWAEVLELMKLPSIPSLALVIAPVPVVAGGVAIVVAAATGTFGSHSAVVTNAIVHPLIWLVLTPLVFMAVILAVRKQRKNFRVRGRHTFARVTGAAPTHAENGFPGQLLLLEVIVDGRRFACQATVAGERPVAPGRYPCFVDPLLPNSTIVQVAPFGGFPPPGAALDQPHLG